MVRLCPETTTTTTTHSLAGIVIMVFTVCTGAVPAVQCNGGAGCVLTWPGQAVQGRPGFEKVWIRALGSTPQRRRGLQSTRHGQPHDNVTDVQT